MEGVPGSSPGASTKRIAAVGISGVYRLGALRRRSEHNFGVSVTGTRQVLCGLKRSGRWVELEIALHGELQVLLVSIDPDEAAAELRCRNAGRPTAHERIQHETPGVARRRDDALEQGQGLLRGMSPKRRCTFKPPFPRPLLG